MGKVKKAPNAKFEKEVISPERKQLIKALQAEFPLLDYNTFVMLTRLSEEELKKHFPSEEDAPPGYYDLKHPESFESKSMTVDNSGSLEIEENDMEAMLKEGMVVLEKVPEKETKED